MSSSEKLRNSLQPGHQLLWYRIESVLGQGGFGITYLAHDTNLDQQVAIKEYLPMELAVRDGDHSVYPASQAHDKRYKWGLDRFLTEARTLARFKHPAIVRVLSVFEENNTAYMVMEYQQGLSLQEILESRRTLPEHELAAMLVPLLEGLEIIHAQGFIHRDIKPSNLFIRKDGHPVLLDFGSARQALGQETRTLTSVVSPGYAPFEQYYSKSDRQGPWTDIYGLGATLYRCLSGLQPMAAIDRSEAILRAERDIFITAKEIGAGQYSPNFLDAVDCALFFNETKRPQTVAEWRQIFEFSTSAEIRAIEPLHTTYPQDAHTRFSALIDKTVDIADSAVVNPQARERSQPSKPAAVEVTPSRRSASGPEAEERSIEVPGQSVRDPNHRSTTRTAAQVWPWLLGMLIIIALGTGYAGYSGHLPVDLFPGAKAARLVAQGDRALAAGIVFEPYATSALAYYQRGWAADPGNPDAAHGLRLSGGRLMEALQAAVESPDMTRAEELVGHLDQIPTEVLDATDVRQQLATARVQHLANSANQQRVDGYLEQARLDINAGKLVGNGTDNALAKLRAAQILAPDSQDALGGLRALAEALAARGHTSLAEGDMRGALEWHAQASLLAGGTQTVTDLGVAVRQAQDAANSRAEGERTIAALLETARNDLAANRLTSPAGNNALERYREVQDLEPDNAMARQGIINIHDRYIALATQALTRGELEEGRNLAAKAVSLQANSEPARALQAQISAAEQQRRTALEERRVAEEEQRVLAIAAANVAAQKAQLEAEQRRKRAQNAEAERLLAIAEAKATAEREAREAQARAVEEAENARPRVVIDFMGFHPKYAREGLTRDLVFAEVAPIVRGAGFEIVTRGEVHDANYRWTNVKLLAYRLSVSENTANGLYSYAGSLNVFKDASLRESLAAVMDTAPLWNRGHNGLGPPTDLRILRDHLVEMARAFVQNRPGRRR